MFEDRLKKSLKGRGSWEGETCKNLALSYFFRVINIYLNIPYQYFIDFINSVQDNSSLSKPHFCVIFAFSAILFICLYWHIFNEACKSLITILYVCLNAVFDSSLQFLKWLTISLSICLSMMHSLKRPRRQGACKKILHWVIFLNH